MIEPTVGRIVWFTKGVWDEGIVQREQPLAATVAYVWNPRMVNLSVTDADGIMHQRTSVALLQDYDVPSAAGSYCRWMPYQKGQAAKTEAAETAVERAKRMAEAAETHRQSVTIGRLAGLDAPADRLVTDDMPRTPAGDEKSALQLGAEARKAGIVR